MIPQRRLSRNSYGNGVSCRVEACRKRLRIVRSNSTHVRLAEDAEDFGGDESQLRLAHPARLDPDAITADREGEAAIT
jgi:hypothetical protein